MEGTLTSAARTLDLDGILHVSVMRSIRKDIEESGSEVWEECEVWMIRTLPDHNPFVGSLLGD